MCFLHGQGLSFVYIVFFLTWTFFEEEFLQCSLFKVGFWARGSFIVCVILVLVLTCKLWQHALGKLLPFSLPPLPLRLPRTASSACHCFFHVFMVGGFLTALKVVWCGHPLPCVALLVLDNITKLNFTLLFLFMFFFTELARILPQAVQNDCQRILMQNLDDDMISLGLKCPVEMACVQWRMQSTSQDLLWRSVSQSCVEKLYVPT